MLPASLICNSNSTSAPSSKAVPPEVEHALEAVSVSVDGEPHPRTALGVAIDPGPRRTGAVDQDRAGIPLESLKRVLEPPQQEPLGHQEGDQRTGRHGAREQFRTAERQREAQETQQLRDQLPVHLILSPFYLI